MKRAKEKQFPSISKQEVARASDVVDLDKVGKLNKIEVKVNGKALPFKIGDKIAFPAGSEVYKTICSVKIDENGNENYLLQWFDNNQFSQYWVSMTELKIMKDNMKQRVCCGGFGA